MYKQVEAHISRNKNRLKSYGNVVYLKDKDNFEIELFNGHTKSVMAKIWINGEIISLSGLVLKPGQRYFLERFIDKNAKFVFETYDVEKSNEALNAIRNNGSIKIEFYEESNSQSSTYTFSNINIVNNDLWNWQNVDTTNPYQFTSLTNSLDVPTSVNYSHVAGSMETGRIEGGGSSKQSFISTNGNFDVFPSRTVELKILPESVKPVEVSDIRNYCSGCGTRIRKQSWKFCPNCGESLDN